MPLHHRPKGFYSDEPIKLAGFQDPALDVAWDSDFQLHRIIANIADRQLHDDSEPFISGQPTVIEPETITSSLSLSAKSPVITELGISALTTPILAVEPDFGRIEVIASDVDLQQLAASSEPLARRVLSIFQRMGEDVDPGFPELSR